MTTRLVSIAAALIACQRPAAPQLGDAGDNDDGSGDAADAMPVPDCPCFSGDGVYCATAIAEYGNAHACGAPGLGEHASDLFACAGGVWSVATRCPDGCYVAGANMPDACRLAGTTRTLWTVFGAGAVHRDLAGLFHCLLEHTAFNDLARGYPDGYGLAWGGSIDAACAGNDYACAVAALESSGHVIADRQPSQPHVVADCWSLQQPVATSCTRISQPRAPRRMPAGQRPTSPSRFVMSWIRVPAERSSQSSDATQRHGTGFELNGVQCEPRRPRSRSE